MKSVSANSFLCEGFGYPEPRRDRRLGVMERRVEAGDLRQRGMQFRQDLYGRKIVTLVQGRQRDQATQFPSERQDSPATVRRNARPREPRDDRLR